MNVEVLIPAEDTVSWRSTFRNGSYSVVLLKKVFDFNGASSRPDQAFMQLSSSPKRNRTLMAYAWVSAIYGFSAKWICEMAIGLSTVRVIKLPYGITNSDIIPEDFHKIVVGTHFSGRARRTERLQPWMKPPLLAPSTRTEPFRN